MQIEVDLIGRVLVRESLYEFLHRAAALATYHDNAVEQVVSIVCINNDTLAVYYRRKDAPGG